MDKLEELKSLETIRDWNVGYVSDLTNRIEKLDSEIRVAKPKEWPYEHYYWISDTGLVYKGAYRPDNASLLSIFRKRKVLGNAYFAREDPEKQVAKLEAIQHINEWRGYKDDDWVDLENGAQSRYYIDIIGKMGIFDTSVATTYCRADKIGHFKTYEERGRCIEECGPQLLTIFGVKP